MMAAIHCTVGTSIKRVGVAHESQGALGRVSGGALSRIVGGTDLEPQPESVRRTFVDGRGRAVVEWEGSFVLGTLLVTTCRTLSSLS